MQAVADGDLKGKVIAVLGLAFKPETDDMRDSPSLDIVTALAEKGAVIRAYDPKAMEEAEPLLPDTIDFTASATECLTGADIAVIVTEWNEFRALTPAHFLDAMNGKTLVDLRNIYRPSDMREAGLRYHSIGRG